MKRIFFLSLTFIFSASNLLCNADLDISSQLIVPVIETLNLFVNSVNDGDTQAIDTVIAKDKPDVSREITAIVKDGFYYTFNPSPLRDNVEIYNPNKVKITGIFSANGSTKSKFLTTTWNISGMSTYFILERIDNSWYITETDFVRKLNGSHFWFFVILMFGALLFWVWMLIDCFNRDFATRGRWFVFLFMFNIIAAIVYFFKIKMRSTATKPAL